MSQFPKGAEHRWHSRLTVRLDPKPGEEHLRDGQRLNDVNVVEELESLLEGLMEGRDPLDEVEVGGESIK